MKIQNLNTETARLPGKKLADTQVPPGWGFICATCRHTFPDAEKYVTFPPPLPCKRLQYDRGGYDRSTYPPTYITPAPIFDLRRYADGSESCPKYEPIGDDSCNFEKS